MLAAHWAPATLQWSLGLGTKAPGSSSVEQKVLLSASALGPHGGTNICWDHLWCPKSVGEREMGPQALAGNPTKPRRFIFHFI